MERSFKVPVAKGSNGIEQKGSIRKRSLVNNLVVQGKRGNFVLGSEELEKIKWFISNLMALKKGGSTITNPILEYLFEAGTVKIFSAEAEVSGLWPIIWFKWNGKCWEWEGQTLDSVRCYCY